MLEAHTSASPPHPATTESVNPDRIDGQVLFVRQDIVTVTNLDGPRGSARALLVQSESTRAFDTSTRSVIPSECMALYDGIYENRPAEGDPAMTIYSLPPRIMSRISTHIAIYIASPTR